MPLLAANTISGKRPLQRRSSTASATPRQPRRPHRRPGASTVHSPNPTGPAGRYRCDRQRRDHHRVRSSPAHAAVRFAHRNFSRTPEILTKIRGQVLSSSKPRSCRSRKRARRASRSRRPKSTRRSSDIIDRQPHVQGSADGILASGGVDMSTLRAQIAAADRLAEGRQDELLGPHEHHAGRGRRRTCASSGRRQQAALPGVGNISRRRQSRVRTPKF